MHTKEPIVEDKIRWKCICAYDGTHYEGWQSQASGNTIQDVLENQLQFIFKNFIRIHGSSRTDSGVHAKGQVFHFESYWKHGIQKLTKALQSGLPRTIQIIDLKEVDIDFHARYDAVGKQYSYTLHQQFSNPFETNFIWSLGGKCLDTIAMQEAANTLLGSHDFSAYAVKSEQNTRENPVKDLRRLDIIQEGPKTRVITEASGYLNKMVRSLVGALVDVGTGKLQIHDLKSILDGRVRTPAIVTAPALGLCLEKVFYSKLIGRTERT
jgi:tRNA pseudouridine38-40 synthase